MSLTEFDLIYAKRRSFLQSQSTEETAPRTPNRSPRKSKIRATVENDLLKLRLFVSRWGEASPPSRSTKGMPLFRAFSCISWAQPLSREVRGMR